VRDLLQSAAARANPVRNHQEIPMKRMLFTVLCATFLAACQSTPPKDAGAPVEERTPAAGTGTGASTTGAGGTGVTGSAVGAGQRNPLRDPNNILSKRTVY